MHRSIESFLIKWKDKSVHLPIILRGARQVGKSYIVEQFGQRSFNTVITVNFEFQPELASCFDTFDPLMICSKLEIAFKTRIIPGTTLLFLDEIQFCPRAITALRYFKEKLPALHVIAAGSLLEFTLQEEEYSFPVGRVQFLYLKPLSFVEYLICQKEDQLIAYLENVHVDEPIDPFIHDHALKLVREYCLIGGMPSVVNCFLETRSFLECQISLANLLETYRTDFPKYASKTEYKYLQKFFENAPGIVAQHFKYSLISTEYRAENLKVALTQLGWAGVVNKIVATSASGIPLNIHAKEQKFKLLFLDIGLVNCANKLDFQTMWTTQLSQINSGMLAEQFVGQELLAYTDPHQHAQLYYWQRDKKGSMAEVDYVVQSGSHIIPIEVKAGTTGSLKSLAQFLLEKNQPFGVRISQHPFSYNDRILSIPFYLISQLPRLMHEVIV